MEVRTLQAAATVGEAGGGGGAEVCTVLTVDRYTNQESITGQRRLLLLLLLQITVSVPIVWAKKSTMGGARNALFKRKFKTRLFSGLPLGQSGLPYRSPGLTPI